MSFLIKPPARLRSNFASSIFRQSRHQLRSPAVARFSTTFTGDSPDAPRLSSLCYFGAAALTFTAVYWIDRNLGQTQSLRLEAPADEKVRLDPATKTPLPLLIPAPASSKSSSNLQLVGLGVRTVSFLSVRVYVSGLYVDEQALKGRLQSLPAWQGYNKEKLLSLKGEATENGKRGEELISEMIKAGIPCVVRIVPVRSTDFGHLRDGFTRSIQSRIKSARKQNQLTESIDQSLNSSIQELKSIFPKASLPKGETLDIVFYPSTFGTGLALEQEGRVLGKVEAPKEALGWSVGRGECLVGANKNTVYE